MGRSGAEWSDIHRLRDALLRDIWSQDLEPAACAAESHRSKDIVKIRIAGKLHGTSLLLKASTINHMPELLLHMLTSDEFQSQCVQDEILGAALPWMCDLLFPGFCIAEIAKFTKHNELYLGLTRPEVAVWATFLSRDRRNRNPSVRTATPQRLSRTTTTVANSNPQPLHATPSSPNPGTGQELTGDPKGLGGGQPAAATEHENESHSNPWI